MRIQELLLGRFYRSDYTNMNGLPALRPWVMEGQKNKRNMLGKQDIQIYIHIYIKKEKRTKTVKINTMKEYGGSKTDKEAEQVRLRATLNRLHRKAQISGTVKCNYSSTVSMSSQSPHHQ